MFVYTIVFFVKSSYSCISRVFFVSITCSISITKKAHQIQFHDFFFAPTCKIVPDFGTLLKIDKHQNVSTNKYLPLKEGK